MKLDIKTVAKAHGVSLKTLAERLGVSRQTVHYYIEQGDRNPLAQLERIADAIGVEIVELFGCNTGDFVAFVRDNGVTHTFDKFEALKHYINARK